MDGTPTQFEEREHLIKENLGLYCPITFEMAKGKKVGAAGSQTQGL